MKGGKTLPPPPLPGGGGRGELRPSVGSDPPFSAEPEWSVLRGSDYSA